MIEKKPVTPISVDYRCDSCKEGFMRPNGEILTSYPAQYPHVCNKCFVGQSFDRTYPYVYWEAERVES